MARRENTDRAMQICQTMADAAVRRRDAVIRTQSSAGPDGAAARRSHLFRP